jgi:hypothetical protein
LGPSWIPAPISRSSGACSITRAGNPLFASACAASPPMRRRQSESAVHPHYLWPCALQRKLNQPTTAVET